MVSAEFDYTGRAFAVHSFDDCLLDTGFRVIFVASMDATKDIPSTSHSKSKLILNGVLVLLQWVLHTNPVLEYIIWAIIAGLSSHLVWESEWTKHGWSEVSKVIASICLAVFICWQVLDVRESQKQQLVKQVSTHHSRIVVSKFVFKEIANTKNVYRIDLHMINRGNIPGYAPVNTFSFWHVEKSLMDTEIDEEMGKVIKRALQQAPVRTDNREQIEVGPEYYMTLPHEFSMEYYKTISDGQKVFYLFVVSTYYDDSLPIGQFWVSEFCAWQGKDSHYLQLCKGYNKTWLFKS